MEKSRSATDGGYTIVQNGDTLGKLEFYGSDGVDFALAADISSAVDGTPGSNDMPGRLVFSTNADGSATVTERMRIDSSGNVGIGNTTPSSYNAAADNLVIGTSGSNGLTIVAGTANDGSIHFADGTSGADAYRGQIFYSHAGNYMVFGTDAVERMRIDSSGNLGLGVTPSAWGGGFKAFELVGGSVFSGASTNLGIMQNAYYDGSNYLYKTTATAARYFQVGGQHIWYTAPSGTAGNAITFTQAMTLDASGLLTVGATSPAGSSQITAYGASNGQIAVQNSTNWSRLLQNSNDLYIDNGVGGSAGNIIFRNSSSTVERARIDSSGNLLVTSAGGLGYGTGSGGAVTQATSRTTGVTLNKTNGAITLVSAAGLATFQSFTVTNSTVAATDVVHVTQKSGTDLYQIFVTATAAGSFRITFATTGGTTTEQPVFNFAVIKAVTA
jgi:hypothetical protein